jgi:Kef-type K+ transport system membrane component KefB
MVFGVLTFGVPFTIGIISGLLLGYNLSPAILMGSIFASHTLVAFPIVTRLGIAKNEAIAVTIGATIITDIASLLVLAAIAGSQNGNVTPIFFVRLIGLLSVYTVLVIFGVPRLGRWFFRRFSTSEIEFQFVLVVIFVGAFLAEVIGMEAIVGAFLVGVAISATLPHRSPVMGRVLFIGESFFIPIFLLSIGMLIDLSAFISDSRTLIISAVLLGVVYGAKFIAVWITARIFGYGQNERWTMWGLSQAQAAATLAATLIGVELGLLDDAIFNAVIVVIMFTCITSPLLLERFGKHLKVDDSDVDEEDKPVFSRVLIPVANPHTQEHLIELADVLARANSGILFPLNIARKINGRIAGLSQQHQLLNNEILNNPDSDVQPIRRVDTSVSEGILNTIIEYNISALIMGWSGKPTLQETILGRWIDNVMWKSKVPIFIGRLVVSVNAQKRVVLVIPARSCTPTSMRKLVTTAYTIAQNVNNSLEILCDEAYMNTVLGIVEKLQGTITTRPLGNSVVYEVKKSIKHDDLVIVATTGSRRRFQSTIGTIPESLAEIKSLSLIVAHYP